MAGEAKEVAVAPNGEVQMSKTASRSDASLVNICLVECTLFNRGGRLMFTPVHKKWIFSVLFIRKVGLKIKNKKGQSNNNNIFIIEIDIIIDNDNNNKKNNNNNL